LRDVTAPSIRLRAPLWLAAAAAALCLLAAAGRDFWSPDEPDFAEHVREMLDRKSLLLPYENGRPYSEKPILYYWALAATTPFTGGDVSPLGTRVPSALSAAGLVFLAAYLARLRGGEKEALLAGAATAVAPIVFWQGQYVQVDALFSCLLMLALVSLYFLEGEEDGAGARRWRWALRVALAAAVLTKGPLAAILAGLVVLARCAMARSLLLLRRLQPIRSIFVFLLLVVPWYVFAARAGGPDYAYDLVVNQNWNRFFRAFDHIQPWWFYLESMWSDFFPWTALALAAPLVLAPRGLFRERPELGFCTTVAAVCFVFLSVSQAKQGKYLLVAYPFAAVLVAALVASADRPREAHDATRSAVRGYLGLAAAVLLAVAVFLGPAARRRAPEFAALAPLVAVTFGAGALVTLFLLWRRRSEATPAALALAAAIAAAEVVAGAAVLPALDVLKTGRPFYERIRPLVSAGQPLAYFGGTYRCYPILVLRRKTEHFKTDRDLADWVERTPGALVLADESESQNWRDARLGALTVLDRQRVGGDVAQLLARR
jgi:4-amino-4-deoxy-L-arabinose transferase-like glycosyltransferase